jgi:MSHA biogenesis protein MshJ
MNARWRKLAARLDALANRERVMVFFGGMAMIFLVLWVAAIEPVAKKVTSLRADVTAQQETLRTFSAQKTELEAQLRRHPDEALLSRLADLEKSMADVDGAIRDMNVGLVSPERMVSLVRDLVSRSPGIALRSLKTLPAEPFDGGESGAEIAAAGETKARTTTASLYKHGVELTVEGSYPALLAYCRRLEALSVRAMWNRTHLDAARHPTVVMTLTLYTLSMDRTWMTL